MEYLLYLLVHIVFPALHSTHEPIISPWIHESASIVGTSSSPASLGSIIVFITSLTRG